MIIAILIIIFIVIALLIWDELDERKHNRE